MLDIYKNIDDLFNPLLGSDNKQHKLQTQESEELTNIEQLFTDMQICMN